MMTTYELRKKHAIKLQENPDSQYTEIERKPKVFNKLTVPKKLQQDLPFKTQEKVKAKSKRQRLEEKEEHIPVKSLVSSE